MSTLSSLRRLTLNANCPDDNKPRYNDPYSEFSDFEEEDAEGSQEDGENEVHWSATKREQGAERRADELLAVLGALPQLQVGGGRWVAVSSGSCIPGP